MERLFKKDEEYHLKFVLSTGAVRSFFTTGDIVENVMNIYMEACSDGLFAVKIDEDTSFFTRMENLVAIEAIWTHQ